jgi:hypothetical protein
MVAAIYTCHELIFKKGRYDDGDVQQNLSRAQSKPKRLALSPTSARKLNSRTEGHGHFRRLAATVSSVSKQPCICRANSMVFFLPKKHTGELCFLYSGDLALTEQRPLQVSWRRS